ncbi:cytochrome P450 [Alphaproteobacteria bacterium KMM 3653]|uniref:Cytochrome P450 n=1 Tax=Harenicola maris TaxID=2841044 RepID=A0AAP2G354_9RHOB|nr:cytochrome P450 [Harenicola maris]
MPEMTQSPTEDAFVQNPYPFYARAREAGPLFFWTDYDVACAPGHAAASAILKDRRFGRECPPEQAAPPAEHLKPFYDNEAHSMLELEPPRHTRLRGLVLRAFTSRRVASLRPVIEAQCAKLIADFPSTPFDLLTSYAQPLPVRVIATLLGVPQEATPDLLRWSGAMVGMYMAGRGRPQEDAAVKATQDFSAYLKGLIAERRKAPGDDLLSDLIAARDAGDKLSEEELISTVILLLNAGHEATVHSIGNGVKAIIEGQHAPLAAQPEAAPALVEEVLRYDPPLHSFQRYAYEDIEIGGYTFRRGEKVSCLLASANHDAGLCENPTNFQPGRSARANLAFGAGLHFCVGAPLARLEMQIAFSALFSALPDLRMTTPPRYAPIYHFHGLEALMVAG